jgi:hypothetical protein
MIELKFFPAYKIMINESINLTEKKSVFREYFQNTVNPEMPPLYKKLVNYKNIPKSITIQ